MLLTVTLGEPAFEAAGQRLIGTALGIAIAFLAFVIWPNPGEGRWGKHRGRYPDPLPSEAQAR